MNLMLELASLTIDTWTPVAAKSFNIVLKNPKTIQKELAVKLRKSQSNVSEGLKRSGYDEIKKLLSYYTNYIKNK